MTAPNKSTRDLTITTKKGQAMSKYNENTTPAILRCEDSASFGCDFKVSPHGPADYDRGAYWVDTLEEALAECEMLDAEAK